jgi:hypothetical protein
MRGDCHRNQIWRMPSSRCKSESWKSKIVAGALPLRGWRAAPPLIGHRVPLAALPNYKARVLSPSLDCCAAGTLSIPLILSPCNLTPASLLPPRPRSHRLLRRLSPVLSAQLRPWSALDPTSIHTVVVASYAHSPTLRSRLPHRRPGPSG